MTGEVKARRHAADEYEGSIYHVRRNYLLPTMEGISADRDLKRWIESVMSDRSVCLVNDRH